MVLNKNPATRIIAIIFILISQHSVADGRYPDSIWIPSGANEGRLRVIGGYPYPRSGHTVTQLGNGEYFVHGAVRTDAMQDGEVILDPTLRAKHAAHQNALDDSPEVFEPSQHAWIRYPKPPGCFRSFLHQAVPLPSNKVLITGGLCDRPLIDRTDRPLEKAFDTNFLWNQRTHVWDPMPALAQGRLFHTATRLKDGSVLIVGGMDDRRHSKEALPVLGNVELFRDADGKQPAAIETMPSLAAPRAQHVAVVMEDGALMVTGGVNAGKELLASVEIYSPNRKSWRSAAPMLTARQQHDGVLLRDGRLMMIGGITASGDGLRSVEIYDPARDEWSEADPLPLALKTQSTVRMGNGDVLIVGSNEYGHGENASYCMRWIQATSRWTMACAPFGHGSGEIRDPENFQLFAKPDGGAIVFGERQIMEWLPQDPDKGTRLAPARIGFATAVLKDGRVMLAGGKLGNRNVTQIVEIYDPAANRYFNIESMRQARFGLLPFRGSISVLQLPDGRVVIAGGWVFAPGDPGRSVANAPDIWNPETGNWAMMSGITFDRLDRVQANIRDDGKVVFFAAREDEANGVAEFYAWTWNPANGAVTMQKVLATSRAGAAISVMKNGHVLIAGGHRLVLIPEFKCPPSSPEKHDPLETDSGNEEQESGDGCKDESAYWIKDEQQKMELWDSRTGQLIEIPFPSGLSTQELQSQILNNGSALLMHVQQLALDVGHVPESPWLYDASTGHFRELPKIDSAVNWPISELADGSLIAWGGDNVSLEYAQRLSPGASRWEPVPRYPQLYGHIVSLSDKRLISLSPSDNREPYASEWNQESGAWDFLHSGYLPVGNPLLLKLPKGEALSIGTVINRLVVQHWSSRTDTWVLSKKTLKLIGPEIDSAILPSGNILNISSMHEYEGDVTDCHIWHRHDDSWTRCESVQRYRDFKHKRFKFSTGNLVDGRVVFIDQRESAKVFDEHSGKWTSMDVEWHLDNLRYEESTSQSPPIARIYDNINRQWFDVTELGVRFLSSNNQLFDRESALWDPAKHRWVYIGRRAALPNHGILLPDGCALMGLPFSIYNPVTGNVDKFKELSMVKDAAFALLDDRTVLAVGEPNSFPEPFYFHRRVGCAGLETRSDDPEYMPPVLIGVGAINSKPIGEAPASTATVRSSGRANNIAKDFHRFVALYRTELILIAISISVGGVVLIVAARRGCVRRGLPMLLTVVLAYPVVRIVHDIWSQAVGSDDFDRSRRSELQPCQFVGVWGFKSYRDIPERITLHGDGRYERVKGAVGERWGRTEGHWHVEDDKMIWLHRGLESSPEFNQILTLNVSKFSLRGSQGLPVRYELISPLRGERCKE